MQTLIAHTTMICCPADDGTLIVSTKSDGTYFIFKDGSYSLIIDKSVPIRQLAVAHRHHVLLFRTSE